jgi:hypothetical protein
VEERIECKRWESPPLIGSSLCAGWISAYEPLKGATQESVQTFEISTKSETLLVEPFSHKSCKRYSIHPVVSLRHRAKMPHVVNLRAWTLFRVVGRRLPRVSPVVVKLARVGVRGQGLGCRLYPCSTRMEDDLATFVPSL